MDDLTRRRRGLAQAAGTDAASTLRGALGLTPVTPAALAQGGLGTEDEGVRRELATAIADALTGWAELHRATCPKCEKARHGVGCKTFKRAGEMAYTLRLDAGPTHD